LHVKKTVSFHVNQMMASWKFTTQKRCSFLSVFYCHDLLSACINGIVQPTLVQLSTESEVWTFFVIACAQRLWSTSYAHAFLTDDTIQSTFNLISNSYNYNEMPYLD
jgi:hypothetical protein